MGALIRISRAQVYDKVLKFKSGANERSKTLFKIHIWRALKKPICLLLVLFIILIILFYITKPNKYNKENPKISCFNLQGNRIPELNDKEPKFGSAIFFHETSCHQNLFDIHLNARQACSLESAIRAHPNDDVFLLITSPIVKPLAEVNNIFVQKLLTFSNFKIRHINFGKYLDNTPLKVIHATGALNYSLWPVAHSSDVLRYTTLYKFGGIYLDLDVLVLKPLNDLSNFAGAESPYLIGSGILGFGKDGAGRDVAEKCAYQLQRTFSGIRWIANGPAIVTKVLMNRCQTDNVTEMWGKTCKDFKVFHPKYFTPLSYAEIYLFFKEGHLEKVQKLVESSYTIHFWNKMSFSMDLNKQKDIAFIHYAKIYCPSTFELAEDNF